MQTPLPANAGPLWQIEPVNHLDWFLQHRNRFISPPPLLGGVPVVGNFWVYASWRCICTKVTRLHAMQHMEHEFRPWLIYSFSLSPPNIECHRKAGPTKRSAMSLQYRTHPFVDSNVSLNIGRCHSLQSAKALAPCSFLLLHNFELLGETKELLGRKFLWLQYIHHSSVSQTSVVMLTKLCRYFLQLVGVTLKNDLSKWVPPHVRHASQRMPFAGHIVCMQSSAALLFAKKSQLYRLPCRQVGEDICDVTNTC